MVPLPRVQHLPRRRLRHQEAAEAAHHQRVLHLGRVELGDGAARPCAGVVDDEVGRAELGLDRGEERRDILAPAGIAGPGARAGLGQQRREFLDAARGERHAHELACEEAGERGAEPAAGAGDEGGLAHGAGLRRSGGRKTGSAA